ncbi:MAG: molybdate ABC transporter substrate-binding protein [Bacillota bacterium]
MKRTVILKSIVAIFALIITGCTGGNKEPQDRSQPVNLTVSAAASLSEAAGELSALYEAKHPGVKITFNLASSGTLQKQIEEGAPVDLFISAGTSQMDYLSARGLIEENTRVNLLGNRLVLVAGNESGITGFNDLAGPGVSRISIGTPETVPAGSYAREVLISLNLWEKLRPRIVLAKDVRQVLAYIETGNVEAGVVYRSDALSRKGVKIVEAAPAGSHKPVVYPMAVIKDSGNKKAASEFASFLAGDEAAKVFEKYGFEPLKKPPTSNL